MRAIDTVADIVRWRLCQGCGACASVCPAEAIRLVDEPAEGIRPRVDEAQSCAGCRACLEVCPGFELDYSEHPSRPGIQPDLAPLFGPVLEIWEGHAADPEIRLAGSSGGALTALALYCLEQAGMHGVLHIGSDPADPVRNRTHLSRSRSELLARTGSRYAPASVCDSLRRIEEAPAPCVFIGQPAEAAALVKARRLRPALDQRTGLVLSFFCAGSPSTQGTLDLVRRLGLEPTALSSLRYRGQGWPGAFQAAGTGSGQGDKRLTYQESWGFLQKYRPYGVHLWPDDTGEAADIACGDPWYAPPAPGALGSSLVVVRTETGRRLLAQARAAGYLALTPAEPWKLVRSQENLSRKRRAIAGRRLAFRLFGLPLTRLRGFPLFRLWLGLPPAEKSKSFFGTLRRIVQRKYYLPTPYPPHIRPRSRARKGVDTLRHHLLIRRERWTLTPTGRLLALLLAAALAFAVLRGLYPFLAAADPIPAPVLVVDGWLPTATLQQAAAEYARGDYQQVLAVRGVYEFDSVDLDRPLDDYVADILIRHGVPRARLASVLFPGREKDRTYSSALAVKAWLQAHGRGGDALDLVTLGAHARRSRLLYRKALGPAARIGVLPLADPAFDGPHWWRTSEGVREVLFEAAAYLYVRILFVPFHSLLS